MLYRSILAVTLRSSWTSSWMCGRRFPTWMRCWWCQYKYVFVIYNLCSRSCHGFCTCLTAVQSAVTSPFATFEIYLEFSWVLRRTGPTYPAEQAFGVNKGGYSLSSANSRIYRRQTLASQVRAYYAWSPNTLAHRLSAIPANTGAQET